MTTPNKEQSSTPRTDAEAASLVGEELTMLALCRTLEKELAEALEAEKEVSNAYLRVRALLKAYDTNHGGENRFEVTENCIKELQQQLSLAQQDSKMFDWLQSSGDVIVRIWNEYHHEWEYQDQKNLREAIQTAMKQEKGDGR
jgi:hypothetical protein